MTIRFLFSAAALLCAQVSFAAVYKCEGADGKVAYQAVPCPGGRGGNQTVLAAPPPASAQPDAGQTPEKKCSRAGKEISINFQSMPLFTALQVIADASGNRLSFSPRLDVSGAFHYVCVPWDTVLADIATRYNLSTRVEAGTIHVRPK